jgi:hypothetical protein
MNGFVVHNVTGEIVIWSSSVEHILCLSLDQMRGRTSIDPGRRAIHEDRTPT